MDVNKKATVKKLHKTKGKRINISPKLFKDDKIYTKELSISTKHMNSRMCEPNIWVSHFFTCCETKTLLEEKKKHSHETYET